MHKQHNVCGDARRPPIELRLFIISLFYFKKFHRSKDKHFNNIFASIKILSFFFYVQYHCIEFSFALLDIFVSDTRLRGQKPKYIRTHTYVPPIPFVRLVCEARLRWGHLMERYCIEPSETRRNFQRQCISTKL